MVRIIQDHDNLLVAQLAAESVKLTLIVDNDRFKSSPSQLRQSVPQSDELFVVIEELLVHLHLIRDVLR